MSYNFKAYSDLEIAESLGDSSYILVEENGEVKRFAATAVAASSKFDLYNIDNLSREGMIALAKELKKFLYFDIDSCTGDLTTMIKENQKYTLFYDDDDSHYDDCDDTSYSDPASWTLTTDAFTLDLTEEEYNEILAAWEALCVNA